ncbi:hypothetical protein FA048_03840 [Pedobacter polaris]|uniref:Uncharacterized protein n=1 Tax=Pedobacter polaris TaxID=2571273 RepID=A0A4U1CWU8_9SPHI|nr:hypothetical protein [Pedobacter polaris]TKC12760.1 hypothetical protein FA048_03840 [Pedobacter polaris]
MKKISFSLLLVLTIVNYGCNTNETNQNPPQQGEIVDQFRPRKLEQDTVENTTPTLTEEEKLIKEGWDKASINNGIMPDCYNYTPKYGNLDNELAVTVGGGTDVAVKVMSLSSDRCIRYIYINSGNTYSIKNIPEGTYYLKIAYGRNWFTRTLNGICEGKFLANALYEKGEDTLDFNRQVTNEGYNIPSFSLRLDVTSGSTDNTFNSNGISEEDFNN